MIALDSFIGTDAITKYCIIVVGTDVLSPIWKCYLCKDYNNNNQRRIVNIAADTRVHHFDSCYP